MRQGNRNEVQSPLTLNDGTVISPDGSYEKDGKKYRLADGECMDMNGYRYKNKMMFNKRRMMDGGGMQGDRQKNRMPQKKQGNRPGKS